MTQAALQASVRDETPEGRSVVELAGKQGQSWSETEYAMRKMWSSRQRPGCPV